MKNNKNYTLYWMLAISVLLTIPLAFIILTRIPGTVLIKTAVIMIIFLLLLIAVMLLYKQIFGVSVQQIAQDDRVTELDKYYHRLTEYRREHTNLQIMKCIDAACGQLQQFRRRKNVMLHLADEETGSESGVLSELVQTVEDALVIYIERAVNRIEIFDDKGMPDILWENIRYIEEQLRKINDILLEFETLITETSRMRELHEEKDISKLRDVVNAMQSLRTEQEESIDHLKKKYDKEGSQP